MRSGQSEWQRKYDASLRREGERVGDDGSSPLGCLGEMALHLFGDAALAVVVCGGALAVIAAFRARPAITATAAAAAFAGGWFHAWRASRSRLAAASIVLGLVALLAVLYLASCSCG